MKKKIAINDIDFADSEFRSFELKQEKKLIVILDSWDARILKIVFFNPIQFIYKLESHISNIYEVLENTRFLQEALLQCYVKAPTDHPFKLFQIEDVDDFPFIEVVAENVSVTKE